MGIRKLAQATAQAWNDQANATEQASAAGAPNPAEAGWQGDTVAQVARSAARAVIAKAQPDR
ncbi:MAG TPA: hypothetical protein VF892_17865 [Pseudonocardiaceae bacterium]